jgi:hypothetical protein
MPSPSFPSDSDRIFHQWHERATARDPEGLLELYTPDATFESPLVPALLDQEDGIVRGHEDLLHFSRLWMQKRPDPLIRLQRSGRYFTDGRFLVWEYPRNAPDGEQVDIAEVMELSDGRIAQHRVFWGWFGTERLRRNALSKP